MSMKTKLVIPAATARNPLVAAALFRHAGKHRPSAGAARRQAGRALQRELQQLIDSP